MTSQRDAEIRLKAAKAGASVSELAEEYGLSLGSVRRIISRRSDETERKIYVGKRTWEKVKELSLKEGTPPNALMGRIVREALKTMGEADA